MARVPPSAATGDFVQLPLFPDLPPPPPPPARSRRLSPPSASTPLTVTATLTDYAAYLVGAQKAPATVRVFLSDLRQLAAFYPDRPLTAFTTADLALVLGQLRQRGAALKTIDRKITTYKNYFAYLTARGLIPHDPAAALLYPSFTAPLPEILTDVEVERLLAVARDDAFWAALIGVFLYAGLKVSEALALQRHDVVLEPPRPHLLVRRRRASRAGRDRVVPLDPRLQPLLARHLATQPGLWLFPVPVRTLDWRLKHYARQAGITRPVSAQDLRNTFAVAFLRRCLAREASLTHPADRAAARAAHDRALLDLLGLAPPSAETILPQYRRLAEAAGPLTADQGLGPGG